jgi:RNA polymerase sigma-70 factor, ECF subfamily
MEAVYRLTAAILGNEADARDATQETFVSAWRQLPGLREPGKFDAWLQRVGINAARQTLRSRRRRLVREIPSSAVLAVPDRAAAVADDAEILGAALSEMPVEQRAILVLHHLEGRPLNELATILDIPVGTAKSRLFAARQALAAAIRREGAE